MLVVAEEMNGYCAGPFKKKRFGLDLRQARRMVQDRSEWLGFVRENERGIDRGMNS